MVEVEPLVQFREALAARPRKRAPDLGVVRASIQIDMILAQKSDERF